MDYAPITNFVCMALIAWTLAGILLILGIHFTRRNYQMSKRETLNSMIEHQRQTLIELRALASEMSISDAVYEQLKLNLISNIAGLEQLRGTIPREEE